MGILIGMDEAGYGPNFGPLVVAATAWGVVGDGAGGREPGEDCGLRIADCGVGIGAKAQQSATCNPKITAEDAGVDLYRLLRSVVAKSASERRIAIADSKSLYHPGQGLRQLERGVHAALHALGQPPGNWSTLVDCCRADPDGHHRSHSWPDGHNAALPVDADAAELVRCGLRLAKACDAAAVRPLVVRARLVFPAQFNELVAYFGSKGAALSHVTVGLLREVIEQVTERDVHAESSIAESTSPIRVVCDKHGARNYYTALLQHHFSEHWIQPLFESHEESCYEWGPPEARVRAVFRMNGEQFLPTALASMTAKYFRELAMQAFNQFWCARLPGLRPTAGYPTDSHRFRRDIARTQRQLGIDDHVLWRNR